MTHFAMHAAIARDRETLVSVASYRVIPFRELRFSQTSDVEIAGGKLLYVRWRDYIARIAGRIDIEGDTKIDASLHGLKEAPKVPRGARQCCAEDAQPFTPLLTRLCDDGFQELHVDSLEFREILDEKDEFCAAGCERCADFEHKAKEGVATEFKQFSDRGAQVVV